MKRKSDTSSTSTSSTTAAGTRSQIQIFTLPDPISQTPVNSNTLLQRGNSSTGADLSLSRNSQTTRQHTYPSSNSSTSITYPYDENFSTHQTYPSDQEAYYSYGQNTSTPTTHPSFPRAPLERRIGFSLAQDDTLLYAPAQIPTTHPSPTGLNGTEDVSYKSLFNSTQDLTVIPEFNPALSSTIFNIPSAAEIKKMVGAMEMIKARPRPVLSEYQQLHLPLQYDLKVTTSELKTFDIDNVEELGDSFSVTNMAFKSKLKELGYSDEQIIKIIKMSSESIEILIHLHSTLNNNYSHEQLTNIVCDTEGEWRLKLLNLGYSKKQLEYIISERSANNAAQILIELHFFFTEQDKYWTHQKLAKIVYEEGNFRGGNTLKILKQHYDNLINFGFTPANLGDIAKTRTSSTKFEQIIFYYSNKKAYKALEELSTDNITSVAKKKYGAKKIEVLINYYVQLKNLGFLKKDIIQIISLHKGVEKITTILDNAEAIKTVQLKPDAIADMCKRLNSNRFIEALKLALRPNSNSLLFGVNPSTNIFQPVTNIKQLILSKEWVETFQKDGGNIVIMVKEQYSASQIKNYFNKSHKNNLAMQDWCSIMNSDEKNQIHFILNNPNDITENYVIETINFLIASSQYLKTKNYPHFLLSLHYTKSSGTETRVSFDSLCTLYAKEYKNIPIILLKSFFANTFIGLVSSHIARENFNTSLQLEKKDDGVYIDYDAFRNFYCQLNLPDPSIDIAREMPLTSPESHSPIPQTTASHTHAITRKTRSSSNMSVDQLLSDVNSGEASTLPETAVSPFSFFQYHGLLTPFNDVPEKTPSQVNQNRIPETPTQQNFSPFKDAEKENDNSSSGSPSNTNF